jgi:hypothetical protein
VTVGDATTRVAGRSRSPTWCATRSRRPPKTSGLVLPHRRRATEPGRCFVIEVEVPRSGGSARRDRPVLHRDPRASGLRRARHRGTAPRHLLLDRDGQLETFSAPFRYVWPSIWT